MKDRLNKLRENIERLEVDGYYGNRHDLKDVLVEFDELKQLILHDVIVPKGTLVCEMRTSMGAENRCVYCGVKQGKECNWIN